MNRPTPVARPHFRYHLYRAIYLGPHAELPPNVHLIGRTLVDDTTSASHQLNRTGAEFLDQLLLHEQNTTEAVQTLSARYPGTTVPVDSVMLLNRLNKAGLLNFRIRNWEPHTRPWRSYYAIGFRAIDYLRTAATTRRESFRLNSHRLVLMHAFFRTLLPWVVLAGAGIGGLMAVGILATVDAVSLSLAAALVGVAAVVHEIAHAIVLRESDVEFLFSPAAMRILIAHRPTPHLARAALAGPVAGTLISATGIVIGQLMHLPACTLLSVIGAVSQLICLTPWAGDGKALINALQPSPKNPSTTHSIPIKEVSP